MFKPIPKSDITIRPLKVFKSWSLDNTIAEYATIRNLSGSFDIHENTNITSTTSKIYNEYALNKCIRTLFYNNAPKLVATVYNWDYNRHTSNTQYNYQVTSSAGLQSYRYYYDNTTKQYINEFQNYLNENEYKVTSKGEIIVGTYSDLTRIYGRMKNYASPYERFIGDRYFLIQIPQNYIGEGIQPGSVNINDLSTSKIIVDDSYGNLVYSDSLNTIVGNIFYENGIITITYKTENSGEELYNFGASNFQIVFKSTKTIYENEIFLEVQPNDFNVSTNPTAVKVYNGGAYIKNKFEINGTEYDFRITSNYDGISKIGFNDYEFSSSMDPTGSYLAPYITTIGLYDEYYNLVAVAKIPSKPKSAPDYPINFIVRFDT